MRIQLLIQHQLPLSAHSGTATSPEESLSECWEYKELSFYKVINPTLKVKHHYLRSLEKEVMSSSIGMRTGDHGSFQKEDDFLIES